MTQIFFDKPSTTATQQILQLQSRGMQIQDTKFAIECLHNIGYYRLSGYWFKFQKKWNGVNSEVSNTEANQFIREISIEDIVNLYRFDTKIRSLFLDALEKIEISITSHMCDYMCNNTAIDWYKSYDYFDCSVEKFNNILQEIYKLIDKNKDKPSLESFYNKYLNEYPPFWIISPYLTFGVVSQLYAALKSEYRKRIADKFGMNEYFMVSSLRHLSCVRNICAHYGRLWDKPVKIKPTNVKFATKLSKFNQVFLKDEKGDYGLYATFYIISLYLYIIAPNSKFCILINNLIERYVQKTNALITFSKMGFGDNWQGLPLFSKMLKTINE